MNLPIFLLVGFAALAMSGPPSAAEPERATGIWSTTDCGSGGLTLLVNAHAALMIEGQGLETTVAIVPAEWTDEAIILKIKGEARDRSLFLDDLKPCDALPGSMSVLLADVVAVFGQLGGIVASCRDLESVTTECVTTVGDLIDVNGDGALSRPELRQAMRTAGFLIAYGGLAARHRDAFVSLDNLLIAQLAAAALAAPIREGRLSPDCPAPNERISAVNGSCEDGILAVMLLGRPFGRTCRVVPDSRQAPPQRVCIANPAGESDHVTTAPTERAMLSQSSVNGVLIGK